MGEALRLAVGGSALLYALLFGVTCLVAEVVVPYHRYAGYLKLLTSVLLVYVAAAFSLHIPWGSVLGALLMPTVSLDHQQLLVIVAIFGTTISPYLFFWQASQEAEESRLSHRGRHASSALSHADFFSRISFDTWIGMAFSNLIAFFIIVTTAATLHASGITKIETASQAAEALRPIAGDLTFALFAAGIIGTGLLAVPVLAGSAAYAVADAFDVRGSLELPAGRALGFYAIVGAATLAGAGLSVSNRHAVLDRRHQRDCRRADHGRDDGSELEPARQAVPRTPAMGLLGWGATGLMALAVGLLAWSSRS
jgi:Mn2+/Fe2+ NRAMP family transporter